MGDQNQNYPRRPSLAQCDYLKFRRGFESLAGSDKHTVTGKVLGAVAEKVGYNIPDKQIKEILASHDLTEESSISFDQFLQLIPRNTKDIAEEEHRLAELREKFSRYDVNGDGKISLQEAQWALQGEMQLTPQTALRLLNQFVTLDYVQFAAFYQQLQQKKVEMFDKFGKYDTNRDGMISADEAHNVLREELGLDESKSRAIIAKFDRNKDGGVSYVEFAEFYLAVEEKKTQIRHSFKRFDSTGCGHVTLDQARHVLTDLLGFSPSKCQDTIDTYDKDGDGRIDYEEFVDFYAMVEEERQKLLTQFAAMDTDHDGLISRKELREMLKDKGYSDSTVDTLVKGHESENDGLLDFDEFKQILNFK